ncbi:hypothetical protein HHX47_DHR4000652 [Lentinula edodes]|nr:hypothetical protein HHX47_DHR4000652 [Lentinula edodes]
MEQSEPGLDNPRQRTVTPLPRIQVFIVILMQLTEPISATVIFPFINQLVLSTGVTNGDEKKSGYYAGIITHAGHDPNSSKVSPCAASVTLKRTKSPTVKSNRWMSLSNYWTKAGQKAGSEDQASLVAAAENTSASYDSVTRPFTRPRSTSEDTLVAIEDFQTKNADLQRTITFRTLLTSEDVLRPLSSLALLSFLETSISVLIPITYTTSIVNGGLGLTAMQLGTLLSIGGAAGLIFSAIGVPPLIRYFGVWKMHFAGMSALIVGFSSIMMACLTAKRAGYADKTTWIFVAIQYASYIILPLGFSEIPLFFWNYAWKMLTIFAPATSQMFVVNGAPSRDALGTTNGMVQSARTLARTVAPVCVMSLFSISKEYNIVHGQLSYVVCLLITICGLRNILKLPRELNRL